MDMDTRWDTVCVSTRTLLVPFPHLNRLSPFSVGGDNGLFRGQRTDVLVPTSLVLVLALGSFLNE